MRKMFLAVLLLLLSSFACAQGDSNWKPPVGIPMPSFGITEDATPAMNYCYNTAWNSNTTTTGCYYVDPAGGSEGACTSSGNGKPFRPLCTIPTTLTKGSYVEVHGTVQTAVTSGNYVKAVGTNETWSAGAAGPVWIRGKDWASRPIFTKGLKAYGAYVIVEDIEIDWTDTIKTGGTNTNPASNGIFLPVGPGADVAPSSLGQTCDTLYAATSTANANCVHHVVYRHIDVWGVKAPLTTDDIAVECDTAHGPPGVSIGGTVGTWSSEASYHDILFWDVDIRNMRKTTGGLTNHAVDPTCSFYTPNFTGTDAVNHQNITHDIWILEGVCSYPVQDCVQSGGSNSANNGDIELLRNLYIGRIDCDHASKGCFGIKSGHNIVLSENKSHDIFDNSNQPSPSKGFGAQQGTRNLWVINNETYNNSYGFFMGSDAPAFGTNGTITSITRTSGVTTVTPTSVGAGTYIGMKIIVSGVTPSTFNGTFVVTGKSGSQFTYAQGAEADTTGTGGTIYIPDVNHDWYYIGNIIHDIKFGPLSVNGCGGSGGGATFNPTGSSPCGSVIGGSNFPENLYFVGNTMYNNNGGFNIQQGPLAHVTATPHVFYANNIFYKHLVDATSTSVGYTFRIDNNTAWDSAVVKNNLWCFTPGTCSATDTNTLGWKRNAGTAMTSFQSYNASYPCATCKSQDPRLQIPAKTRFTPTPDSSVINAGDNAIWTTIKTNFQSAFGFPLVFEDYQRIARDSQPDIGAAEYSAALPGLSDQWFGDRTWVTPTGVPTPTFGVTQTATSARAACVTAGWTGNCYFICNDTQANCASTSTPTDTSNTNGSPATPRLTFPAGAKTLTAGTYIEVKGQITDALNGGGRIDATSCTSGSPCWIRANSINGVIFTKDLQVYGNYLIVENIKFKEDASLVGGHFSTYTGATSSNLAVRHSEFAGNANQGTCCSAHAGALISPGGATSSVGQVTNMVVWDNYVHDYGSLPPWQAFFNDTCTITASTRTLTCTSSPFTSNWVGTDRGVTITGFTNAANNVYACSLSTFTDANTVVFSSDDGTVSACKGTTSFVDETATVKVGIMWDKDEAGIQLNDYIDHAWVVDNIVQRTTGNGFQIVSSSSDWREGVNLQYVYGARNYLENFTAGCMHVKPANHVVLIKNECVDGLEWAGNGLGDNAHGVGLQLGPRDVWIIGNYFHGSMSYGVVQVSDDTSSSHLCDVGNTNYPCSGDSHILYNIFANMTSPKIVYRNTPYTNTSGPAVINLWTGKTSSIAGNLLYNFDKMNGIFIGAQNQTFHIAKVRNNLIYGRVDSTAYDFASPGANINGQAGTVWDYNLTVPSSGTSRVFWNTTCTSGSPCTAGSTGTLHTSFSTREANSLTAEPVFGNTSRNNFVISSTSVAKNAGVNTVTTDFSDFDTQFGSESGISPTTNIIKKDFAGTQVPQAGLYDIGPLENGSQLFREALKHGVKLNGTFQIHF